MKTDELISAGNTFASTFFISFVFIFFAIIEPHFAPKGLLEQHADEALQEIDDAKRQLRAELARIRVRHLHIGSKLDESIPPGILPAVPKSRAADAAQLERDEEELQRIHEKMVQLDLAQQAMEKTKLEKKQYNIPLVNLPLDEDSVLKFFPILVIGGLARLLFYRRSLLNSISPDAEKSIPLWAAPVPMGRTKLSFGGWMMVNVLGFFFSGIIVLMSLRFVFSYARENFSHLGLVVIDALLIFGWVGCYVFLIARAIFRTTAPPQTNILETE